MTATVEMQLGRTQAEATQRRGGQWYAKPVSNVLARLTMPILIVVFLGLTEDLHGGLEARSIDARRLL